MQEELLAKFNVELLDKLYVVADGMPLSNVGQRMSAYGTFVYKVYGERLLS